MSHHLPGLLALLFAAMSFYLVGAQGEPDIDVASTKTISTLDHQPRHDEWYIAIYNGTSRICPFLGESRYSYKFYNQTSSPCGDQCHKWDEHPGTGSLKSWPVEHQISIYQDSDCQTLVDHRYAVHGPLPTTALNFACVKLDDYESYDEGYFKVTCPEDLPKPTPPPTLSFVEKLSDSIAETDVVKASVQLSGDERSDEGSSKVTCPQDLPPRIGPTPKLPSVAKVATDARVLNSEARIIPGGGSGQIGNSVVQKSTVEERNSPSPPLMPLRNWSIVIKTFNCCRVFTGATHIFKSSDTATGECIEIVRMTSALVEAEDCTVRFFQDNACQKIMNKDFSVITGTVEQCVHLTLDPAQQNSSNLCDRYDLMDSWHFNGSWRVDCPE